MPILSVLRARHRTPSAAAVGGVSRQGDAPLPQADPLKPPPARRARDALARTKETFTMSASVVLALLIPFGGAHALDQRSNLTPGIYQAAPNGCAHPSGVGTMTFDGANFSGNHQYCRTTPANDRDRYHLECMDMMGGNKTIADFDSDPDKESFDLTIRVIDKRTFSVDGQRYDYCGGLK